jgi:hypothetical protein
MQAGDPGAELPGELLAAAAHEIAAGEQASLNR